jgi:hypothetical protein
MAQCAWGYLLSGEGGCKNEGQPIMCFEHDSILESFGQLEQLLEDERISEEEYNKQWELLVTNSEKIGR